MPPSSPFPTTELLAGRRSLDGLPGLTLLADWSWHAKVDRWVLGIRLTIQSRDPEVVPNSTDWCVLVEPFYPWGSIKFYPTKVGGLLRTFPHQLRNDGGPPELPWRTGEICLTTPSQALGRLGWGDEPRDPHRRLEWHARRAIAWIEAAGAGRLSLDGDPFELPHVPTASDSTCEIVAFSEGEDSFRTWETILRGDGWVELAPISGNSRLSCVERFTDFRGNEVARTRWGNGFLSAKAERLRGLWLLLDGPPILSPWHVPSTWGELDRAFRTRGRDLYEWLTRVAPKLRDGRSYFLLIGFPISEIVGGPVRNLHWFSALLPPLSCGTQYRKGFRANEQGYWRRDREEIFRPDARIDWKRSENWHSDQLSTRGRFTEEMVELPTTIVGVGAMGSTMAELLARGGTRLMQLIDGDSLAAGNLIRHTLILPQVGRPKAEAVAERLRAISPHIDVDFVDLDVRYLDESDRKRLLADKLILDCTGSDDVLHYLSTLDWPEEKAFCSVSLGARGRRLYVFLVRGRSFPLTQFQREIEPWIQRDSTESSSQGYPWEGVGCWHPVFPADPADVWLLASSAVKWIESQLARGVPGPALSVFESEEDQEGFVGVRRLAREAAHV